MAAVQSIGLGSDNALKQETIDKLKKSDEKSQITPIEKRITKSKKQNTELSSLLVSIAGMKGAQNPLYSDIEYLKVNTNVIGNSVKAVVSAGVSPQNINIKIKQLAKADIIQSNGFITEKDVLAKKDTTINISINGRKYDIKVKGSDDLKEGEEATTLKSLKSLVLEGTSGKIIGSTINTGGDNPHKLILKSRDVGKDNSILVGTLIKSPRIIDQEKLDETVFQGSDLFINDVQIFGKISKTKHLSTEIDTQNSLPFRFNPKDLQINGVDIFDNTTNAQTTSSDKVIINATSGDGDFSLNGINIFDTSPFAEVKSTIDLDNLNFPLDIGLNTLSLNEIDIFNTVEPTIITTSIVKDDGVAGVYKHNNLMINGVSIFDEDTNIDSVESLVDAINDKTDDTNISANAINLTNGNIKIQLTNQVNGDNIDINTNDSLQLSKMRLYKGVTLGSKNITIKSKLDLIDLVNLKKETSNVEALEADGKLFLRSTVNNGKVLIKASNSSFINQIGLQTGNYSNPIPIKLESIDDIVSYINKKTTRHNIVASNKDGNLYLEQTKLGEDINIGGTEEFLEKIKLTASTIKPERGKLISSIDELVDSINGFSEDTFVRAKKENNKLSLETTKEATDIIIAGKVEALAIIGLTQILVPSINGEKLKDSLAFIERINEKSEETNVQAFLGNDNKITLLNTLGGDIVFRGIEDKIKVLNFSTDDSIKIEDADNIKDLLEKLGISKSSQKLQLAQDSIFDYNGVEISRDTNSVTDIIEGVDFQFQQIDSGNNFTNISITKNKEGVINSFFEFITAYNSFIRKIDDATRFEFDEDTPKDSDVGVFQGKTTITGIPFQLSSILGKIYPDLKINSLISLGIDFSRDGTLSYEEEEIRNKINSNFQDVQDLFSGYNKTSSLGKSEKIDGVFKILNTKINDLTQGGKSVLESFKSSIEQETGRLSKTLTKTQETIDSRYKQLQKSFIANDSAISKLNNNFSALKTQMEYETAKN